MRKLYLSSIALIVFALSGVVFQLSCSEEAVSLSADYILPAATETTLGGIIVGSGLSVENDGTLSVTASNEGGLVQKNLILYVKNISKENEINEYWIANLDGSNQHKVNITLAAGLSLRGEAQLSPDGTRIIFSVDDSSTEHDDIYSVSVNGGVPTKIISGESESRMYIQGVH